MGLALVHFLRANTLTDAATPFQIDLHNSTGRRA